MPRTISAADHLSRSASAPVKTPRRVRDLAVLAVYAAAGTVLTVGATARRRHRPASHAPQRAAQTDAAASLAA